MEMWTWKRLLKVSWTEMKSNILVLTQVYEKRILLSIIRERSEKMCGYLLRHNSFVTNIFEGWINGHKGRGRPRKAYLEEMTKLAGCNRYADMKILTINREEWRTRFATTR